MFLSLFVTQAGHTETGLAGMFKKPGTRLIVLTGLRFIIDSPFNEHEELFRRA